MALNLLALTRALRCSALGAGAIFVLLSAPAIASQSLIPLQSSELDDAGIILEEPETEIPPILVNEAEFSPIIPDLIQVSEEKLPRVDAMYDPGMLIQTPTPSARQGWEDPRSESDLGPTSFLTGPQLVAGLPTQAVLPAQENTAALVEAEKRDRFALLQQADTLFQAGQRSEAEQLYRQAKNALDAEQSVVAIPQPFSDPAELGGAGRVYWREGMAGFEKKLETKIIVPLKLLVEQYPQFVPGHLKLAEAHNLYQRPADALVVLERAASQNPTQPDLQRALMVQQADMKAWLNAAITARQFAALNPEHPEAADFAVLAEQYQKRFEATLREDLTSNAIGSVLTGTLSLATGNPFGMISPLQNAMVLLRGEDSVGSSAAKSFQKKFTMVEDPEVVNYVNRIGQSLAKVSGRDLAYAFYVFQDEEFRAFALPGGKVFVSTGAIEKTESEAELAAVIAHELSHAVLSHGFQMYTQEKATGGFTDVVPFSGLFSKTAVTKYSRQMEAQADLLGTRLLARAGYAADSLESLAVRWMAAKANGESADTFQWISSHPNVEERVSTLAEIIDQNGYPRYAFEGVREHKAMQDRLQPIVLPETTPEAAASAKITK
jgi:predicted Zn-dependent protease